MSTSQKQTLEVVRNIIVELDKEILTKQHIITMIKTHPDYQNEYQEQAIIDWEDNLQTLKKLRDFIIYKA
jgi:hypothetical protein